MVSIFHLMLPLFGLAVGSFLNVLVLRTMAGRSCGGRSACMHCGHTLAWYELVPLVSYLVQAGRCRGCRARLSLQYPLVELLTALVFFGVGLRLCGAGECEATLAGWGGLHLLAFAGYVAAHLAVWSALIAICVYDLRTTYIPDRFSYTAAGCALAALALEVYVAPVEPASIVLALLAGPLLVLPFYLLWKVSHGRWMGLGDGKLALSMGWLLGIGGGFSAAMFGFWLGAIVAVGLLAAQRLAALLPAGKGTARDASPVDTSVVGEDVHTASATAELPTEDAEPVAHVLRTPLTLTSEIPFGPFLVAGTAIVYFTGITYASLFGLDGSLFTVLSGTL